MKIRRWIFSALLRLLGFSAARPGGRPFSGSKRLAGVFPLKEGQAVRVVFFYPGEEGTYVEDLFVTLYSNGVVHMVSSREETTSHIHNCEIVWQVAPEQEDRGSKLRLLKLKGREPISEGNAKEAPETPKNESSIYIK